MRAYAIVDLTGLIGCAVTIYFLQLSIERKIWLGVVALLVLISVNAIIMFFEYRSELKKTNKKLDDIQQKHTSLATQYNDKNKEIERLSAIIDSTLHTLEIGMMSSSAQSRATCNKIHKYTFESLYNVDEQTSLEVITDE